MARLPAGLWDTVTVVTKDGMPYCPSVPCLATLFLGPKKRLPYVGWISPLLNSIASLGSLYLQPLGVIPTSAPLCWRTSLRCLLPPKDGSFRRSALGKKAKDDGLPTPRGPAPSMLMGPFTSPKSPSPGGVLAHSLLGRGSLGSDCLNLLGIFFVCPPSTCMLI